MTTLPQKLALPNSLKVLSLVRNNLTAFSEEIELPSELEELDLSGNHITVFPVAIFKALHLKKLRLDNNEIRTLPEEILKLPVHLFIYMFRNPFQLGVIDWVDKNAESTILLSAKD